MEGGIKTLAQFLDAPPEALKGIGMSYRRVQGFREALFTAKPAWIRNKQVSLRQPALFYDVETGLTGDGGSLGGPSPQHPWMIGAMVEGREPVEQSVALAPRDRTARPPMSKD